MAKIAPLNTLKLVWQNIIIIFCYIHEKCFGNYFLFFYQIKSTCCQQKFFFIVKYLNIWLKTFFLDVSPKKIFLEQSLIQNHTKTQNFIQKKCWVIFFIWKFYSLVLESILWDISAHWCSQYFFHSELLICHELKPCSTLHFIE